MMTILWTVVAVWLGLNSLVGVIMLIYVFGRKPAPVVIKEAGADD